MTPFIFADYVQAEEAEARAAAAGNHEVADAVDNVLEEMTVEMGSPVTRTLRQRLSSMPPNTSPITSAGAFRR
jgi:hypothetical protein